MEEQQQQPAQTQSQNSSTTAVGKKVDLAIIDKKTLEAVISSAGKERISPLKNAKRTGAGGPKTDLPKFELCELSIEERTIQETVFDNNISRHLLQNSIVSIGACAFLADALTGCACPHYFFTIPSARVLVDLGVANNGPSKGRAKRIHSIAGRFSRYHGRFATLDNLFTYLHCVMGVSTGSVIFKDILKMYNCTEEAYTSKKLHDLMATVNKSKVFGGSSNLTIPAQASRLPKALKRPGCFYYGGDDESPPFGHSHVKHSYLRSIYQIPSQLKLPCYEDWISAVERVKSKREGTIKNHEKWKQYALKHGKEATMQLYEELKLRKKRKRALDASGDDGIVELEDGDVVLKKPRLVDEPETESDSDDEDYEDTMSISTEKVRDEMCGTTDKEDQLIEQFLKTLGRELRNPLERDPEDTDWGEEGTYSDVIDSIDWEGVDRVDDSSRYYKKKVKRIYHLLQ